MIRPLCLLLCLAWLATGSLQASEGAARVERLQPAFEEIVFGSKGPRPRDIVLRVEGPVVIQPSGPLSEASREVLRRHAQDLADLTGYPVRIGDGEDTRDGERPFWLYLAYPREMPPLLNRSWIPYGLRQSMPRALCSFVTRGDHRIKEGVILINRGLSEATIAHCLIEETTQALGAIDDTLLLEPSAFNDLGSLIDRLQPDDRVILRALFAPGMAPGLTRAAVQRRLPDLLEDALRLEAESPG